MSVLTPPNPAKLVIGCFLKSKELSAPVAEALKDHFGEMDMKSPWMPFDYTRYYEPEMGRPLFRRVFAFKILIGQDDLADIKHVTRGLEDRYLAGGKRRVNIDPGYMLHERFVLASGKNFTHRIYIGKQVYADLTLIYRKGRFESLPWTYPDYADEPMQDFLYKVRGKYTLDLRRAE